MTLFELYSTRARRVIFFALAFAQLDHANEITPEHILHGVLKVDPQLFGICAPGNPVLVDQIESSLKSGVPGQFEGMTVEALTAPLPLSEMAKVVVAGARQEKERLSQGSVATQHLWLALAKSFQKPRGWSIRRKLYECTDAHQILADHGLTAEVVESRIKEGIDTATSTVLDDPLFNLNAQLTALAELLISKGFFSRSEFVALLDQNEGPLTARTFLAPLIDSLFKKGTITAAERATIEETAPLNPKAESASGSKDGNH